MNSGNRYCSGQIEPAKPDAHKGICIVKGSSFEKNEPLIECVPNFSEGRDEAKISAIARAIAVQDGVQLLHIDPSIDANRTVMTFAGSPSSVIDGAFYSIERAAQLIDMSRHSGEHPRVGATDVCPLVPLRNISMAECAQWACELGRRVARDLEIPVYLYAESAAHGHRRELSAIRRGGYEALSQKMREPEWAPDFGDVFFNPRTGVTVIGARKLLIAFNVNLKSRDERAAREIARHIRESGRMVYAPDGRSELIPGRLKACQALGWYLSHYQFVQVSMNLTDYQITPIHMAFETVKEEASLLGITVTGSEVVGMVPLQALLDAGSYYLEKQKDFVNEERILIQTAINSLGLNDLKRFNPEERILEYRLFG